MTKSQCKILKKEEVYLIYFIWYIVFRLVKLK